MLKDQPSLALDGNVADSSLAATITLGPLRGHISPNACSSQTQSVYHGGCDNAVDRWVTCPSNVNADGSGNGLHGIYDDFSSVMYHGYGYTPLMPQRPCPPFTAPAASVSHHGQLYNVQDLSNLNPTNYQQIVPPNIPFSQAKLPVNTDLQGNASRFGSLPGYLSTGSFGSESNFSGHSGQFKFLQQEGFDSGGLDWSEHSNGKSMHLQSPGVCPNSIHSLDLAADQYRMASQQKESLYAFGSHSSSSFKSHPQALNYHDAIYKAVPSSIFRKSEASWPSLNDARSVGGHNDFSCTCTVAVDTLTERNRGPRAFKPRSETAADAAIDSHRNTIVDAYSESYNRLDFVTDYKYAKFFVIKSYSEDNVHKSIKYGVWASTANGNKKLDAAYREAKEKHGIPVFLLFSVNASAQFCGVAEMVGPVDFDKSVDFWQQDKWSGQFPVKWHIIKDVPNNLFRHIVLQNNDNKPVTNSRDTQEVEVHQGIEMLNIFKKHDSHSSILDDFLFYEERQKAMQIKKLRQQASPASALVGGAIEPSVVSLADNFVSKMSKSFAEAVLLKNNETLLSSTALPRQRTTAEVEPKDKTSNV